MASATAVRGSSSGKVALIILAVIGIVAIIVGALYMAEPAKSLPSILGTITSPASRADAHRSLRGAVSLGFGVVCLVAAGIVAWRGKASSK
ncbi:MAG TPA: DUF4345 family protein [Trebonia sp.]|nr:DUF4345 family protein [Trebonia sp.]